MLSQFSGPGGALVVSFIAFTIVFAVLAGLTAVIYAIKLFAGGESGKNDKDQSPPATSAPESSARKTAVSAGADGGRIAAVVAGAILAATRGKGRILSIVPAGPVSPAPRTTWKTTGIVERVSGRLVRSWKQ